MRRVACFLALFQAAVAATMPPSSPEIPASSLSVAAPVSLHVASMSAPTADLLAEIHVLKEIEFRIRARNLQLRNLQVKRQATTFRHSRADAEMAWGENGMLTALSV
jgi:hypothetical protein